MGLEPTTLCSLENVSLLVEAPVVGVGDMNMTRSNVHTDLLVLVESSVAGVTARFHLTHSLQVALHRHLLTHA